MTTAFEDGRKPWPETTLVREAGLDRLYMIEPGKAATHSNRWEYEEYVPKGVLVGVMAERDYWRSRAADAGAV